LSEGVSGTFQSSLGHDSIASYLSSRFSL